MKYTKIQKTEAKKLFLKGYKIAEIVRETGINKRTIYDWKNKEEWGELISGQDSIYTARKRLETLFDKKNKTLIDLQEIELCTKVIEKLEGLEIRKMKAREKIAECEEGGEVRKNKKRRKAFNDFSGLLATDIEKKLIENLFDYQLDMWYLKNHRIRMILKSRQIGMTWYFAREALADALINDKTQIFLSATRNQADMFREYIKTAALEWFGIEVKGKDKVELMTPSGGRVTLHFLSTSAASAQGYSGNVYIDEYFWIPGFEKLNKVASAMATQSCFRKTYFSTPSAKSHKAFPMWSGDKFNERMKDKKKAIIPFPTRTKLKKGCVWAKGDKAYRRIITMDGAIAQGFNRANPEDLKLEYTEHEYKQLFECYFIDDSASVFKLSMLEKLLVDSSEWKDFKPDAERPFGNRPVWIGYDPSRSVDNACIVVMAAPLKVGGKFRVLEKITIKKQSWHYQARVIQDLTKKYNVQYIGIDCSGPGSGVFEQVQQFYPRATAILYSIDQKTRMVLKAQQIIQDGRVEWDSSHSDIAAGFMLIRQTSSKNDRITYVADRSDLTGHADAAWAVMHVFINEGLLSPDGKQRKARLVIGQAA